MNNILDNWKELEHDKNGYIVEYVELKAPYRIKKRRFSISFIYDLWCEFNENRKVIIVMYGNPTFKQFVETKVSMMFR